MSDSTTARGSLPRYLVVCQAEGGMGDYIPEDRLPERLTCFLGHCDCAPVVYTLDESAIDAWRAGYEAAVEHARLSSKLLPSPRDARVARGLVETLERVRDDTEKRFAAEAAPINDSGAGERP